MFEGVDQTVSTPEAAPSGDVCFRCGYSLHGVADDGACPECGLLAARSRHVSDALHDAHPRWLRRLSFGVWLVLFSLLLLAAAPFTHWLWQASGYLRRTVPLFWENWLHVRLIGFTLAAATFFVGVMYLTRPEGRVAADRADRWQRLLLRVVAFAPLLALLTFHVATLVAFLDPSRTLGSIVTEWTAVNRAALVIGVAGGVPLPLLLFRRLRSLARRARSAHLAEHCTIVGAGLSATVAYTVCVVLLMRFAPSLGPGGSRWASRSSVPVMLLLTMSVAALLFLIWSFYLMVRFAVAFGLAGGRRRRHWRQSDRSVVTGSAGA